MIYGFKKDYSLMAKTNQTQRGGTLLGIIVGCVLGLGLALFVAIYINRASTPVMEKENAKLPPVAKIEEANKASWDPNAALAGKNPARPAQDVSQNQPATSTEEFSKLVNGSNAFNEPSLGESKANEGVTLNQTTGTQTPQAGNVTSNDSPLASSKSATSAALKNNSTKVGSSSDKVVVVPSTDVKIEKNNTNLNVDKKNKNTDTNTKEKTMASNAERSSDPLGDLIREKTKTTSPKPSVQGNDLSTEKIVPKKPDDVFTYFVQAGAFRNNDEAQAQKAKLVSMGMEAKITEREQAGRIMYRVRTGPFSKEIEAERSKEKLVSAGIDAALVRVQK